MRIAALLFLFLAGGCASLVPRDLPEEPPPLADMKEPVELLEEPDDEAEREKLDLGAFTGLEVKPADEGLDEPGMEPEGLVVKSVVENSPADAAGLLPDDILISAVDAGGAEHELSWPSQWRKLELAAAPGTDLVVAYDRAGMEREARIRVTPRVRAPGREEAARLREERRIGVVVRTATEVEARRAGLGPGGGAVVVGLSRRSPWRKAGIRYGDLIVKVGGRSVDHPQVVLDAIREAKDEIKVVVLRGEKRKKFETPLSRRERRMTEINVPPLFSYESDRGESELSVLLGLVKHRKTKAAWELRILWLFRFGGGDADRLEEVDDR